MKRFLMSASVALVAMSGAAFADQHGANNCAPGQKCPPGQSQKVDNHSQKPQAKGEQHAQATKASGHSAPGHAPTAAQLKRLPAPPKGQEYRIVNDKVVRIDSDTLKTVAAIGLVSAILSN